MVGSLLYLFLISIYNMVLFYGKNLGLNVLVFMIPLTRLIYKLIIINKKKINKKGFLFIIPILLISLSFLLYNNELFNILNIVVIYFLFILMYIYVINEKSNFFHLLKEIVKIMFLPITCVINFIKLTINSFIKKIDLSDRGKTILKTIIIIIPISIFIIMLLSSADKEFNNIFVIFYKTLEKVSVPNIVGRVLYVFISFIVIGSILYYLINNYKQEKEKTKFEVEDFTIKVLLTVLNIIYLVFDFIQIKSLFLHNVSSKFIYSEYAREGFFQLMIISTINIIIILISKHSKVKSKYNVISSLLMVLLTSIIMVSSFLRMHLYEAAYGYTLFRLLVYYILITEAILIIPTIIYIFKKKYNVLKVYVVITVISYTILSLIPVNYIISKNNVDRYFKTNQIDLNYLMNYETDNVIILRELYDRTDEEKIKKELKKYFTSLLKNNKIDGIQEYNISKVNAAKRIEEIKDIKKIEKSKKTKK